MAGSTFEDSERLTSDVGGSMFREASGINIHGGTFNAYGSSATDDKKRIADAMALLGSRAEQGASYDAAAREDVPKCQEHTRVAIIDGIHKWANTQESGTRPFMWMYGPAGSGKTTIMQTVAEIFDEEGSLATSFFFSKLAASRPRDKENFVITLAHQLSLRIPSLQQYLADALSDSSVLTKSLAKQLDALVIGPLNKLASTRIDSHCIFLVDGLDECNRDSAQRDVLELLHQLLDQARYPIRILVASRSLSHIQAFFSQRTIGRIIQTTPLDNHYETDKDIEKFLSLGLAKIRDEHPSGGWLSSEWPSPTDIDVLVRRASGQFIYASVVMKFIADQGRHPDESLQTIIALQVIDGTRPYEELDAVYAQVLSTIEPQNAEFVQTLLACMIMDTKFIIAHTARNQHTTAFDELFNIQPGTTDARINRLRPLITKFIPEEDLPPPGRPVSPVSAELDSRLRFSHASFPEYLLDRSRSKEFFIDMAQIHTRLALHCFNSYALTPAHVSHKTYNVHTPDLRHVILHCLQAEWTSELRDSVTTFDIKTAFHVGHALNDDTKAQIFWWELINWVDFIFWAEKHHKLSPSKAEHIRECIKNRIQSVLSEFSVSMLHAVVLLTFEGHLDCTWCWSHMSNIIDHPDGRTLVYAATRSSVVDDAHIHDASVTWLCRSLVEGHGMDGSFLTDGTLYADLALLYLHSLLTQEPAFLLPTDWHRYLTIILSKASPSMELATCLFRYFLQVPRWMLQDTHANSSRPVQKNDVFTAILIYLFQCGVPVISQHQHAQDFDPFHSVCGICLLFDPFKGCADIELSRDPSAKSNIVPMQIRHQEAPLQIDRVPAHIPAVPILWIQTWILWLADTMARFLPVAT